MVRSIGIGWCDRLQMIWTMLINNECMLFTVRTQWLFVPWRTSLTDWKTWKSNVVFPTTFKERPMGKANSDILRFQWSSYTHSYGREGGTQVRVGCRWSNGQGGQPFVILTFVLPLKCCSLFSHLNWNVDRRTRQLKDYHVIRRENLNLVVSALPTDRESVTHDGDGSVDDWMWIDS